MKKGEVWADVGMADTEAAQLEAWVFKARMRLGQIQRHLCFRFCCQHRQGDGKLAVLVGSTLIVVSLLLSKNKWELGRGKASDILWLRGVASQFFSVWLFLSSGRLRIKHVLLRNRKSYSSNFWWTVGDTWGMLKILQH